MVLVQFLLAFIAAASLLFVGETAESVTKRVLYEAETQTVSNKSLDNTNTYTGGTFNAPTFTTPTLSGATFSGTSTFSALTANTLLSLNGSKVLQSHALTNGQLLIGSTGAVPVVAGLTGTASQITVTPGAGSITLSTPQDIATTSSPTFAGMTLTGVTANTIVTTNGSSALAPLSSAIAVADGGTGTGSTPSNGQLLIGNGTGYTVANVTNGGAIGIANGSGTITLSALERSYLSGYTMSTAGSSSTMSIAVGQATNSDNTAVITLGSAINKSTAGWSVGSGNGCLDTGSIANTTWYHFYAILRPDTGVVDVLCSLSATAPSLPASYTKQRRIGSGRTNGSAQWTQFVQNGDEFLWTNGSLDVNTTNPGTSAVLSTLLVPTNVQVWALVNRIVVTGAGGAVTDLVSSPDQADAAPSLTAAPGATLYVPASSNGATRLQIRTNASGQIRSRLSFSDGSTISRMVTVGWIDRRGRDS